MRRGREQRRERASFSRNTVRDPMVNGYGAKNPMRCASLLLPVVVLAGCGSGTSPREAGAREPTELHVARAPNAEKSDTNVVAPAVPPGQTPAVSAANPEFDVYAVNDPSWREQTSTPP